MKSKFFTSLALATSITLLAGCSSPQDGQPNTPSESASDNASTPAEEPTPEPQPTEAEPAAPVREVPSECSALTLDFNTTYSGAEFSKCVTAALTSFGSGRMDMYGDDLNGNVNFTYAPDYSFEVTGTSNGQATKLVYVGTEMWVDNGAGWIKGDINSSNQEEMLAGLAGELYRIYADPAMTAELIAGAQEWRSGAEFEMRGLPSGDTVEAYRIVNTQPFAWHDMQIQEFVMYYRKDWVPVGSSATSSMGGMAPMTYAQDFWDLGADISIKPPM